MGPCKNIGRTLAFIPSLSVIYGRITNDSKTWGLEIIVVVSLLILWGGFHGPAPRLHGLLAGLGHICSQLRSAGGWLFPDGRTHTTGSGHRPGYLGFLPHGCSSSLAQASSHGGWVQSTQVEAEGIGLESAQRHFHCWPRQATQIAGSREPDFTS